MPYLIGSPTNTKILKSESQKLHHEFEVGTVKATITFDADLVTSNSVIGSINGVSTTAVVFATDHDTTMDLLVTELESHADVLAATLTDATDNRQITITAVDPDGAFVLASWAVTAGSTQAGTVTATDTNDVHIGQPVRLQGDGTIEPVPNGNYAHNIIGIAMHEGDGKTLVTVAMKAFMIVFMECATDGLLAGPVTIHSNGYNTTTKYIEVDDASVTVSNILGFALDGGDDGDIIRVAIL